MTAPPVDEHRVAVELLIATSLEELADMWPATSVPEAVEAVLLAVLPPLVDVYGSAAATLGADWYDDVRDAAGETGRFRAIVADLPDAGRIESLVGWGIGPLFPTVTESEDEAGQLVTVRTEPDPVTAQSLIAGGLQRIVADADRNSVIQSLARDPRGKGWERQTTGKSCDFCVMLANRGAVYSATTANFSAHDYCDCVAVPVFGGDPRPVEPYVPSQRRRTAATKAADNARVREFLRTEKQGASGSRRGQGVSEPARDIDAGRTVEQLRSTAESLERSLQLFESPATRARLEELRRKIAART